MQRKYRSLAFRPTPFSCFVLLPPGNITDIAYFPVTNDPTLLFDSYTMVSGPFPG